MTGSWYLVLPLMVLITGSLQAAPVDSKVYEFVETVLVGTEYGPFEPVVSRWTRSPELSLFDASDDQEQAVLEMVYELNEILKPAGTQLKIGKPLDENAVFKIYFANRKQFPEIAARHHFEYVPGNAGFFYFWWNPGHEIHRAVVMIDKKQKGKQLRHYVHEEITQALGPANDSPIFSDSIFFEKGRNTGKATRFNELDRKLIFFLYKHVRPGYGREKIRETFEKHWE